MRSWLASLFGTPAAQAPVRSAAPAGPPREDAPQPAPSARPVPPARPAAAAAARYLPADDVEFLEGLLAPSPAQRHLDELPRGDRLFLGGIVRRLHARQLDLPVFPEAALRVSGLLRESNVPISRYVALLTDDPALSLEVLRVANSAFYGSATRTASLHDAIVRIGLGRLESILLMAHLKSRVMKGGSQRKAELLLDLALPTAALASRFAPREAESDLRFMRGMLMHVEHLVILGTIADVSREHRTVIAPSAAALHQAFAQFGPEIRDAVAAAWKLKDILPSAEVEDGALEVYRGLRDAIVCRWLDRPLPAVDGVQPDRLFDALSHVEPRARPAALGTDPSRQGTLDTCSSRPT